MQLLNILLSALFSNTLSRCSSLNIRDNVSHPYRTTDKTIILYNINEYEISSNTTVTVMHSCNKSVCNV
jgi:hypothetical protein